MSTAVLTIVILIFLSLVCFFVSVSEVLQLYFGLSLIESNKVKKLVGGLGVILFATGIGLLIYRANQLAVPADVQAAPVPTATVPPTETAVVIEATETAVAPTAEPTPLVAEPTATAAPPTPTLAPTPAVKIHIVGENETLWEISYRYYNTGNRWTEICEANKGVLADCRAIIIGMALEIPLP